MYKLLVVMLFVKFVCLTSMYFYLVIQKKYIYKLQFIYKTKASKNLNYWNLVVFFKNVCMN